MVCIGYVYTFTYIIFLWIIGYKYKVTTQIKQFDNTLITV